MRSTAVTLVKLTGRIFLCTAERIEQLSAELETCQTALQFTRQDMEEKLTYSQEVMQKQR
jgi:hypothetical protein